MCGVIVVDAGRSRSTNLGRDANNDHCLDIVIIIRSSINCPTVTCLPAVCYVERPLVKPMAPGSSFSYYLPLRSNFLLHLFLDLLNQKPKNTLLYFILFAIYYFNLSQIYLPSMHCFWRRYPKGIDNPFNTSGCEVLLFVCRGCLRCVSWFSY